VAWERKPARPVEEAEMWPVSRGGAVPGLRGEEETARVSVTRGERDSASLLRCKPGRSPTDLQRSQNDEELRFSWTGKGQQVTDGKGAKTGFQFFENSSLEGSQRTRWNTKGQKARDR